MSRVFGASLLLLFALLYVSDVLLMKRMNPFDAVFSWWRKPIRRSSVTRNALLINIVFFVLFVASLYQGSLLTTLLVGGKNDSITTVQELIVEITEMRQRFIAVDLSSAFYQSIYHSNFTQFQQLREALAINPPLIETSVDKAMALLTIDNLIYAATSIEANNYISNRCDLTVLDFGPFYTRSIITYLLNPNTRT